MPQLRRNVVTFCLILQLIGAVESCAQTLSYSTYLNTYAGNLAVDASGEVCMVTSFVSKFRSDGSMIYSIASTPAAQPEVVAIDSHGNCYVGGNGTIIPTAGAFQSIPRAASSQFIEKFDGSGNLVFATYLSGSESDRPSAMAVDLNGNVYVTGAVVSNDFPTQNAFQSTLGSTQDAFISALNATGTALIYSTYWGGASNDSGAAITVDSAGNAYITGSTDSANFPVIAPFQAALVGGSDAFVIKLDPAGKPIYSTFLGGSAGASGLAIAADTKGSAYVTGTAGAGMPLVTPIQASTIGTSAFVTKFAPDGSALVYSTYLGEFTTVAGISVDSAEQAYIGGSLFTNISPTPGSVPLVSPIQSAFGTQTTDGYMSVINASGTVFVFSTYLGGDEDHVNGFGIDGAGNLYASGYTMRGFPITNASDGIYVPIIQIAGCGPCLNTQSFFLKIGPSTGPSFSYPTTVDFTQDPRPIGNSTQAVSVLIANTSASADVGIGNIAIQGDFSQTKNCPSSLKSATRCELQLIFTPTAAGQRTGAVTLTDTAPGSPHVINLIGTGAIPIAQLMPTSLIFPAQVVGSTSASQAINLENTGNAVLTVSNISTSGDFTESNYCSGGVPPAGTCQISVVFSPTATENRMGTLTIVDNAAGSPQTVSLSGTGANPSLGLGVASGGSSTATVAAGKTASYVLAMGGAGISGTAALSCTGAPTGATCSVPASQNVNANTATPFTASITTSPPMMSAQPGIEHQGWLWAAVMAGVCIGSTHRRKWMTRRFSLSGSFVATLLILLICSCGGSSSGSRTSSGTPSGTYALTIKATLGSTTQSVQLTLIVQ